MSQGLLAVPDKLSELGGIWDARPTLRYLLGKIRAPGLERSQLGGRLLDSSGADLLVEPASSKASK